jgi:hypothetical protein
MHNEYVRTSLLSRRRNKGWLHYPLPDEHLNLLVSRHHLPEQCSIHNQRASVDVAC